METSGRIKVVRLLELPKFLHTVSGLILWLVIIMILNVKLLGEAALSRFIPRRVADSCSL